MEKILADLLSTAAAPLVAALTRNSDLLERVVAGQEAAMAKLEGVAGGAAKPTRARRATAEEKPPEPVVNDTPPVVEQGPTSTTVTGNAVVDGSLTVEPATAATHVLLATPNAETVKVKNPKTGAEEDTPTAAYRASDFSRDQVKNEFIGWLGETTDMSERKTRSEFVTAIGQHFGVTKPFDPTNGLADDDARKQTLFFLRRKRAGLDVNFSADYDFDADPLAADNVADDSDIDPLG
jgi:hypothetical protein